MDTDIDDELDPIPHVTVSSYIQASPQPQHQTTLQFTAEALAVSQDVITQTPTTEQKGDRCAVCVKAYCTKRWDCNGKGNRSKCSCGHPPLRTGERVRTSEKKIVEYLARQSQEGN